MYNLTDNSLGIYEKALPHSLDWQEKLSLAESLGFDFVEMSIDESNKKISRLDWTRRQRIEFVTSVLESNTRVPSLCLSCHRKFPLGSEDKITRIRALDIMKKAIELAVDIGVRNIQLAGYDIYYAAGNSRTRDFFLQGLQEAVVMAGKAQVLLSMEIMDYPLINSITKFLYYKEKIQSPWFMLYPDIGNISAWSNDICDEFKKGIHYITAIHLKDTLAVTGEFKGKFKEVDFGSGCVEFAEFFKILKELNYRGSFLMEMWNNGSSEFLKKITVAKQWLVKQAQQVGYNIC